jgi:quercetin dioxygenase-like cupin family protein
MPLPQDISPLNPALMDTVARAAEGDWIPTGPNAFMKILWTGAESGQWAALFRWPKGYQAPPHKHLSAAHTYVLSGRLELRDGEIGPGDYVYERNGMVHGSTTALEDSEYLFICEGPVLFYDDNGFTSYLGWEQVQRMKDEFAKSTAA